jgi:hypothetical protein
MTKQPYIVDSEVYPIAWRFNSEDCLLSDQEKQSIVFLDEKPHRHVLYWCDLHSERQSALRKTGMVIGKGKIKK